MLDISYYGKDNNALRVADMPADSNFKIALSQHLGIIKYWLYLLCRNKENARLYNSKYFNEVTLLESLFAFRSYLIESKQNTEIEYVELMAALGGQNIQKAIEYFEQYLLVPVSEVEVSLFASIYKEMDMSEFLNKAMHIAEKTYLGVLTLAIAEII